jgi:hypothetical protein
MNLASDGINIEFQITSSRLGITVGQVLGSVVTGSVSVL